MARVALPAGGSGARRDGIMGVFNFARLNAMNDHTHEQQTPAEIREASRLLYESTPLSLAEVAKEIGCGERSLKRYSSQDGGWKKQAGSSISQRAHKAADLIAGAVSGLEAEAAPEQAQAVLANVREDVAVDERAVLIARHRSEWRLIDGLLAATVRSRDLQAGRLAEVVARVLTLKQNGECRAWGLDHVDVQAERQTIVIERV